MTEFDLIYRYFIQQDSEQTDTFSTVPIIKSLGDDAAVIVFNANSQLVTCVDTLVQGRHFSDNWSQIDELAFAIGYKAVAVNVSDVIAMGATPHSILLALSLPERLANKSWLESFSKGLFHACHQFNARLIGGDTTRHDKLVVSITANGIILENVKPIYRSGANVGDKIYVSGTLGDASYALKNLDNDSVIAQQLAHRLHMPTPRLTLSKALAEQNQVTAMIDISDGLVQDLGHICKQSNVAIHLNLEKLPTSKPLLSVDVAERLQHQLAGGDDYELVFTLPSHVTPPQGHTKVTCIGEVIVLDTEVNNNSVQLSYNGLMVTANNPQPFDKLPDLKGFQHF